MLNSITMSAISGPARLMTAVVLALAAWGGDNLKLADGLIVDYKIGGTLPGVITANVVSNLGVVPYTMTAQSSGWLTVTPTSGMTPTAVKITVNPLGLGVGTYAGSVTVHTSVLMNGRILDASDTSPITLRVSDGAPPITEKPVPVMTAVVNPADYGTGGETAAGGWIAILGEELAAAKVEATVKPYPKELGKTKVLLDGRALPLMMVSPTEVYAFVPYDVEPGGVLPLVVERDGVSSKGRDLAVSVQVPAVFLKDPKGPSREARVAVSRGFGANTSWFDASVDNPVMAGDILYLDAISLGPVDKDVAPDKVAPDYPYARVIAPATVTIDGLEAQIWYLGLIPGTVGVYQVRIEVPAGVAAGNAIPIVVTVEGQASAAVTVAVR